MKINFLNFKILFTRKIMKYKLYNNNQRNYKITKKRQINNKMTKI